MGGRADRVASGVERQGLRVLTSVFTVVVGGYWSFVVLRSVLAFLYQVWNPSSGDNWH